MRRFLGTATLFVCLGAITCGGRVIDDRVFGSGGASGASFTSDVTGGPMTGIGAGTGATGSSATSGPGTTSGPGATTGPSTTTGFTTTTGGTGGVATTTTGGTGGVATTTSTTTTGGIGGSVPVPVPVPDPKTGCSIVCGRWASCSAYSSAQCENDCNNTWIQSMQCTPQFSNFLGCLSVAPFQCGPGGPVPSGCDAEQAAFSMCSQGTQPDPGLPQCGSVKPPAAMSCSGSAGGGSVSSGSTGGPSMAQCQNICFDGQNNIWISNCIGNSCTCSYNGKAYCGCATRGDACSSRTCCPGL